MSDVLTTGGLGLEGFLSTKQAAESLGVPRGKILSLIYGRKLGFYRVGRWYFIHQNEVERVRASIAPRLAA